MIGRATAYARVGKKKREVYVLNTEMICEFSEGPFHHTVAL